MFEIRVTVSGTTPEAVRSGMEAFLGELGAQAPDPRTPPEPVVSDQSSADEAAEDADAEEWVRDVFRRIPKERKAREILRLVAEASVAGRLGRWVDLLDTVAGGDGKRMAGYTQSITKAAGHNGRDPQMLMRWDDVANGWRMDPAIARATLKLLELERES